MKLTNKKLQKSTWLFPYWSPVGSTSWQDIASYKTMYLWLLLVVNVFVIAILSAFEIDDLASNPHHDSPARELGYLALALYVILSIAWQVAILMSVMRSKRHS